MDYLLKNHLSLLIIAWLLFTGLFGAAPVAPVQNPLSLGGNEVSTIGNWWKFTNGFQMGSSGTNFDRINSGTCYIKAYAATIAATSSAFVDCQATAAVGASGISALTGVTYGDSVFVAFATSTGTTLAGLVIQSASASGTPGYMQLNVSNLTGTTFTWPTTGTASGTASYIATDFTQ